MPFESCMEFKFQYQQRFMENIHLDPLLDFYEQSQG